MEMTKIFVLWDNEERFFSWVWTIIISILLCTGGFFVGNMYQLSKQTSALEKRINEQKRHEAMKEQEREAERKIIAIYKERHPEYSDYPDNMILVMYESEILGMFGELEHPR